MSLLREEEDEEILCRELRWPVLDTGAIKLLSCGKLVRDTLDGVGTCGVGRAFGVDTVLSEEGVETIC